MSVKYGSIRQINNFFRHNEYHQGKQHRHNSRIGFDSVPPLPTHVDDLGR